MLHFEAEVKHFFAPVKHFFALPLQVKIVRDCDDVPCGAPS